MISFINGHDKMLAKELINTGGQKISRNRILMILLGIVKNMPVMK
jgi:hypothetical protein